MFAVLVDPMPEPTFVSVKCRTASGCKWAAGDRTKDSLLEFAEALVPSAGQPHRYVKGVTRMAKTPGCNLSGAINLDVGGSCQQTAARPCALHFLLPSGHQHRQLQAHNISYCQQTLLCGSLSPGFVLVKKVPGTLHFMAKSAGHSFDFVAMNMSHVVHQWFFGNKPSPRRRSVRTLHPPPTRCPQTHVPELSCICQVHLLACTAF